MNGFLPSLAKIGPMDLEGKRLHTVRWTADEQQTHLRF
jgi:hypothetical protein